MANGAGASRGADIAVVGGCGHVGLPLGLAFARAGKTVVAVDIDEAKVRQTNQAVMPFRDQGADELLPKVLADGTFRCTTDRSPLSEADVIVSIIGTPVDEHLNPQVHVMQQLVAELRPHLRAGQMLVLRSTVYPGTTQRVEALLRRYGLDVDLAYCPERVAQGAALAEIASLPQIVAGCTERAQQRAEELFGLLTGEVVPMRPLAAELTKLFTNAWRYVQFAAANQFFMIANDYGIDFYEIHAAMTQNYPRTQGFPRAGFAAGPCLFKDTMQLSAFHENSFFLGHAAMLINEGLPNYVVQQVARHVGLAGRTAGILGMTFKADSDDPRESLAFKLAKILRTECREVLCSDPYLQADWLVGPAELVERADVIFVGAPHRAYRGLDFGGKPVVDIWNSMPERMAVL